MKPKIQIKHINSSGKGKKILAFYADKLQNAEIDDVKAWRDGSYEKTWDKDHSESWDKNPETDWGRAGR
jgi:hypothetical protein